MSWFGATPVAKISPKGAFYFLTEERINNGFFKISGCDSIVVSNPEIREPPEMGKTTAIPREFIDKLHPAKHFLIRTKLIIGRSTQNFSEIPLGDILTESVWKYYSNPKFLTRALFSAGEPCLDLGDSIVILSCGKIFPKFADEKVWDKLTKAMNETFNTIDRFTCPEFTIEIPKIEGGITERIMIVVYVSLSKEIKDIMTGKRVGTFVVPEKKKVEDSEKKEL